MRGEAPTRTCRSGFGPLCAKGWALLCLALGCLNPSPDDQPSEKTAPPGAQADPATGGTQTPSSSGSNGNPNGSDDLNEQPTTSIPESAPPQMGEADAGAPRPDAGPDAGGDAGMP
jgi:hypothetical protein